MRALLQRVSEASVAVHHQPHGRICRGLVVLLGVEQGDGPEDIAWLVRKIVQLRIFNDDSGTMNRSLADTGGEVLVVSQFTLHASTRKGNRPSYSRAAPPAEASPCYDHFVRDLAAVLGKPVATGVFGADMQVALVNDGPVTILIDSRARE